MLLSYLCHRNGRKEYNGMERKPWAFTLKTRAETSKFTTAEFAKEEGPGTGGVGTAECFWTARQRMARAISCSITPLQQQQNKKKWQDNALQTHKHTHVPLWRSKPEVHRWEHTGVCGGCWWEKHHLRRRPRLLGLLARGKETRSKIYRISGTAARRANQARSQRQKRRDGSKSGSASDAFCQFKGSHDPPGLRQSDHSKQ